MGLQPEPKMTGKENPAMRTEYVVWIHIEQCEADGDDYDRIETIGEPRQAGCFRSERRASERVEYLLEQAHAARKTPQNRRRRRIPGETSRA